MSTTDNPAGRLYQAIIDMDNSWSIESNVIQKVFENTFDVPFNDRFKGLFTLASLIQLTLDGEKLVESLEGIDRERYLEPILAIGQVLFKTNLDTSWGDFRSEIDENTLSALRFVSDMLSMRAGKKVIDEASLTELLADVNTMLEKLLEARLPEDLKVDLVDHLEDLRSDIIDYRLLGLESLKKTFDNNLGLIIRRRDEMEEVENSEGEGIFSDFARLVSKLDVIISAGTKFRELVEPIIK